MNRNPLISVIVPNYNHARFLKQRIDSILSQTLTDFELILLDDCSSDNSREILTEYEKDSRVSHIIFNDKNSGSTFRQWDKGFSLASGKYIWIAESDDFADPDFLEHTVNALENQDNAVMAFSGSRMVDEHGRNMEMEWDKFRSGIPFCTTYEGNRFIKKYMITNNSVYNASMVLFKRECIERVSRKYKTFTYCGDWLFWTEICMLGNVIKIGSKLNYFRQHGEKVSVKAVKNGLTFTEGCIVIDILLRRLNFSLYERLIVSGRIQKRLYDKISGGRHFRKKVMRDNPDMFIGWKFAILIYELDKLVKKLALS